MRQVLGHELSRLNALDFPGVHLPVMWSKLFKHLCHISSSLLIRQVPSAPLPGVINFLSRFPPALVSCE